MLRGKNWPTLTLTLIAAAFVNCLPSQGDEPKSHPHDNSGRSIAQVMPIMPPAVTPAAVPTVQPSVSGSVSDWAAAADSFSDRANEAASAAGERLSSIAAPVQLTPAARQALWQGVTAAQGMSRLAAKRLADFATWGAVLFDSLNGVPRLTPATSIVPLSPVQADHPASAPKPIGTQQLL